MSLKSTILGAITAVSCAFPAFAEIEIHDQYARSSNTMSGAAFMIIHNHSEEADHLLSVSSDAAQRVELHTHMEDENGVMKMTHVEEGFGLPAGGELLLKRGGAHVMFMGLTAPFEQNEVILVTFLFENAGEVIVEIPVDQDRMEQEAMQDMDHGAMDDAEHDDMDHGDLGSMDHGSDH